MQFLGLQESGIRESKDIMKIETIDRDSGEVLRTITDRDVIDHRCTRKTTCPVCKKSLRYEIPKGPRSVRTVYHYYPTEGNLEFEDAKESFREHPLKEKRLVEFFSGDPRQGGGDLK